MKKNLFILCLFFLGLFATQQTFACSCIPLPPIYKAYENADAVFIGKVTASNEPDDDDERYNGYDIIFDFDVIENFKGAKGKKIKLNRGTKYSSCYGGYSIGETYLVYAGKTGLDFVTENSKQAEGVVFQGSFCDRTSPLKTAQDQLFFIREMLSGKPENQIYGSVARSDTFPNTLEYRRTYLENIKVILEGENNKFETLTDKNGLFRFNDIPAGEYNLKPALQDEYSLYFPGEEKITVLENKQVGSSSYASYSEIYKSFYGEFILGWNNRMEGRVVDSEGKPFERYVIGLLPLSKADSELNPFKEGSPDHHGEKGTFWDNGNTPGKYILAVDVYAPFGNASKKRFFYPNAETVDKAKIFDISATDKITGIEMKLPFTIRFIKGELYWNTNEFNNDNGWIVLNKLENQDDKLNTVFDWEGAKDGKFTIQVLEGFEYWIHSKIDVEVKEKGKEKDLEINSKPQKVKIGKEDYPLKLIFQKPKNLITQ